MKKNSGQALVEFIIILPVLLLIVIGMVDFGNIILKKYHLEGTLDTVVELYHNNRLIELEQYLKEEDTTISYQKDDKFTKLILTKQVNIVTPGLNIILDNPYEVSVERVVYEE